MLIFGHHVTNTAVIGSLCILSESGIGTGLRRIEAVTGAAALEKSQADAKELEIIAGLLKVKTEAIPEKLENLLSQMRETERELQDLKKKEALSGVDSIIAHKETIAAVPVVTAQANVDSIDELRDLADTILDRLSGGVVLLGAIHDLAARSFGLCYRAESDDESAPDGHSGRKTKFDLWRR